MASLALEFALFVFLGGVKTEINGQNINVSAELHTTVDLPCRCPICPETTTGVQWYRSSSSDAFIKDGKALVWWSDGGTGSSQGFGIKNDFSMNIFNLTDQHDQDLYRCIVFPVGGAAECTHDVNLRIYANPNSSPVIEYIRQTDGFNVTCSINNVFPMTFPILTATEGTRTAYINSDGTYNTAVTSFFAAANEKDTTIECLFSYLNFKTIASLFIVNNYTIDQPKEEDTTETNIAYTDFRCMTSGLWIAWIILIIEALFFIVYAIKSGRAVYNSALAKTIRNTTEELDRYEDHEDNSKEEEPTKFTRNVLLGKLSCAVITLIVQFTALILLVACLATVRCSIESGGQENVTCTTNPTKSSHN